jgi:hypothetical protein
MKPDQEHQGTKACFLRFGLSYGTDPKPPESSGNYLFGVVIRLLYLY